VLPARVRPQIGLQIALPIFRGGRSVVEARQNIMKVMLAAWLGGTEWVIVILAVLLLFGSKRIPDLARSLGQSIKEFKKGAREVTDEIQNAAEEKPAQQNKSVTNGQSQPNPTVSQSSNPPKT
jgi:sec-independent protein translocase protein TatA